MKLTLHLPIAMLFVASSVYPLEARAQTSGADKASAEALFNEGVALVASRDFAEGCRKFEGSQSLDPTLGTELRLADCYERLGRTASAWASFKHARSIARIKNQAEREELARQRVEALQPRLSYLRLRLSSEAPEGLVVERNGRPLPLASLGVAIPVDPGQQTITVRAPGYERWQQTVAIASGPGEIDVRLPPLSPRVAAASQKNGGLRFERPATSTQRTAGYLVGAVGAAGLLTSAGLGLYAKHEGDRSRQPEYCPTDGGNGCTQAGVDLRDKARSYGDASTIALLAGAALATTGVILFSTAPGPEPQQSGSLHLRAAASTEGLGTSLRGTW